jgi:hypothetical protein
MGGIGYDDDFPNSDWGPSFRDFKQELIEKRVYVKNNLFKCSCRNFMFYYLNFENNFYIYQCSKCSAKYKGVPDESRYYHSFMKEMKKYE